MIQFTKLIIYRKKLITPHILRLLRLMDIACYILSLLFIVALVYNYGFRISPEELRMIHRVYDFTWLTFAISSVLHITLDFKQTRQQYNSFTWIATLVFLSTLLPHIISIPEQTPLLSPLWSLLSQRTLTTTLLIILSTLQLSNGIVRLLTRKVNPSTIIAASFLIFIVIGTGMLMLPRATYQSISIIDALFMSTSAVCVTGLSTVDVASTFTPMGEWLLLTLIQIGGLGVMTLTSFFAMFFMGNSSLNNQVMVSDMVSSKSLGSLFSTLLYILGFTFIIEALGAVLIFLNIHDTLQLSLNEEIAFSIFHSISAFCNAGFSTMSNNLGEEILLSGHNIFFIVVTLLIILGSIGFPILVNIYETLKYTTKYLYTRHISKTHRQNRQVHLYGTNTRIVLIMTLIMLSVGTFAIAILEWNNAFASMPTIDKLVHSFFNAACPRTAGFSSVAISSFSVQTIIIYAMLMVVGGGTQSTAGGIKVNVFAVILLNLRAILFGRDKVTVLNRELSNDSIRRSNSTLLLYIIIVCLAIFTLTLLEPEASLKALSFEAISALSTVGSSLDLTATLGNDSKLVIIILMFVGRIGVLTMMSSLIKQRKLIKYKYPSGNIIIN